MIAQHLARYASEIERTLRTYASIAPQLGPALQHHDAQRDEALSYLEDMRLSLTELRHCLPQLAGAQLIQIEATLGNLTSTIQVLRHDRQVAHLR